MISIVIPLYNKEKQIAYTLQSVFAQTYQKFEIIIVNDGSTDNSIREVENIVDKRIRLIHQTNAGVSAARNRGIEEARYDLIAFLDADDEWKPEYLATQYNLYKKYPTCTVYACNYECKDDKGKITPTIIKKLPFNSVDGILTNYFEVASCSHPPLWTSAIMTKKNAIQSIGGFPLGIKSGEDLITWASLAIKHKIAFYRFPLAIFITDSKVFNEDQKKREPEKTDEVGSNLKLLYKNNPNIAGLKGYNSLWHKMRSRIFISKGKRSEAIKECCIALKYNFSSKLIAFLIIALLPNYISKKIFKK